MDDSILSIANLNVSFRQDDQSNVDVVQDLSLEVTRGSSMAIIGESGSGKSVTMRSILRLLPPTALISGSAKFNGVDLLSLNPRKLRTVAGNRIGFIFQNAMTALNPTMPLERQLTEHLLWHGICGREDARSRAVQALGDVGIPEPERRIRMYPFQLSGGMRQRAMIAMAMVTNPDLLIADEPTTALDVTIQRQILNLLKDLKDGGLSIIMITHDLGVARYFCDDASVMYAGQIAETSPMRDLLERPNHPYTRGLINSNLDIGDTRELTPISGNPPNLSNRPTGCAFHPRCSLFDGDKCLKEQKLIEISDVRSARCWRAGDDND